MRIQALSEKMQNMQKLPFQVWLIRYNRLNRIRSRKGFGLNEVIGIAAGLLIAGLVIIPGLMDLANAIIVYISGWWSSFAGEIFTTGA